MNETRTEDGLNILFVEDNPGDARLVIELFREYAVENHAVCHVSRLSDALALLEENDYDVVLLDLSLPDAAGVVTVQRVRATVPHVPVVVLTGLGDETTAIEAVNEGAEDYLVKSEIDDAGLIRATRYAIGRHKRMNRIAFYDALTNLPNRSLFYDRLTQALVRGRRYGDKGALLFIDLDGFKRINDTFGHETGDGVLRMAARRMRETLRASDVAARFGGDEFIVLLPALTRYEDALLVAEKLRVAISLPHAIGERDVSITASIGAAVFPLDGSDPDGLIESADRAMYRAKASGKNQVASVSPFAPAETDAGPDRGLAVTQRHA